MTRAEAIAVAAKDANVAKERALHPDLSPTANWVDGHWEVAWFADGKELALVLVDPESGEVTESWTGYQVAWKMARGYEGQFGHKLNAPYVFLPLCVIFLLGLVDWRRWRRLVNLDLLVLLGFGVSHFFFNQGEIGVSVPLAYPVLLYLLARALWIGFRGGGGLRPRWPAAWLLVAALFLMGFRVGLNVADSGVADIGYAERGRRRPDRPRRTDLRQLPRRHLPGRHLRPGQLPRLRPLRADLALVGELGRRPRRPRRSRSPPTSPPSPC